MPSNHPVHLTPIQKKHYKALYRLTLNAFKKSEAYQTLLIQIPKPKQYHILGYEWSSKSLPNLNQEIEQLIDRRITPTFIYKTHQKCSNTKADQSNEVWITMDSMLILNGMAKYAGYQDFSTFKSQYDQGLIPALVGETLSQKTEILTKDKEIPNLKKYVGLYEGYYVIPKNHRSLLCNFAFALFSNGKVCLKTRLNIDEEPIYYEGSIEKLMNSKTLKGELCPTNDSLSKDESYHFFFFFKADFSMYENTHELSLDGVYSGKGRRASLPMGGRIQMYRITQGEDILPETFNDLVKQPVYLHSEAMRQLNLKRPHLKPFFLGQNDIFMESVLTFENSHWIERSIPTGNLKRIAGTYLGYRLTDQGEKIAIQPICIDEQGDVWMKSIYDPERMYRGRANLFSHDKLLALRLRWENKNPYFGTILCFVGSYERKNITHLEGVFSFASESFKPMAGRIFLYKSPHPLNELEGATFSFNELDLTNILASKAGLSDVLATSFNNLVLTEGRVNTDLTQQKNEYVQVGKTDYARMLFQSACFHAAKGAYTVCLEALQAAIKAGFQDKYTLAKEVDRGLLKPLQADIDIENLQIKLRTP